ncbi:MAG: bis(5'-nucleosyl)-tetraphosphatase (symmetrical) YqeK [Firmicutes bacterium]|nr:bis(5'-nucleosyl)-tetraphosphatase (symmetrical) YqeK [Bacillota bacterium]
MKKLKDKVKGKLKKKRFLHTEGVVDTAVELCKIYGIDGQKAILAGYLHDYTKYMKKDEILEIVKREKIKLNEVEKHNLFLVHGYTAAVVARDEFAISDEEVLDAIRYHTFGRVNMTILDMIMYVADAIEPEREYDGIEQLRKLAKKDIEKAYLMALEHSIKYVIDKNQMIHPNSIESRNAILMKNTEE